ncbi:acyl-CoA thioesterase [Nocardia sp. NBC_00565]|uniref:acyl-CoA thioesterase n=1 Tax=Nocardia sp. NBC_00565 TaxID=2975993 RepID=UPI002E809658|nr:hotdog domain-containing protein [Nocardia sp. NBC_00565]WUC00085.1 acyl-CoA thioesterase [Nocardia sp. NBC_00565]
MTITSTTTASVPSPASAGRRSEAIHRFLVKPDDAGITGSVDGGKLLEWIDKVAYAAAAQWSGRYCVTAYVGNIHLDRPIAVGELVELHANLVHTGRTSMHILVSVYSSDPTRRKPVQTAQCLTIFVAIDDNRRTVEVPQWNPSTILEQQRHRQARARISVRKRIEEAMAAQHYTAEGTAPSATLRFLSAPSDINWGGKVHGGRTMGWIDEAAYVCGADWVGQQVITSYFGGIRFYQPMVIGHIVEVTARLIHTGPRSMHVSVHVTATDTHSDQPALAAHGHAVVVAVENNGKARSVRQWTPVSDEDRALDAHARHLIELRAEAEPFTMASDLPADAEPNYFRAPMP